MTAITNILLNNHTQLLRLPMDMRFDECIKQVYIRKVGNDRIVSPVEHIWDSFFLSDKRVSDDFMVERHVCVPSHRISFD